MTTTTFRSHNDRCMMAADSRVSFQNAEGQFIDWKDYDDYLKAIEYNDTLYGFAGTNVYFANFLRILLQGTHSDVEILDFLASEAKKNSSEFLIMRYHTDLRIYGYLKNSDSLYDSSVSSLTVDKYGIGSGAYSKVYKRNKDNISARYPIKKIIEANEKAISKALKKSATINHRYVCNKAGSDHGTGGVINMTTMQTETNVVQTQIDVLARISTDAHSSQAVAVCSFDASEEKKKLDDLGVSPNQSEKELSLKKKALFEELSKSFISENNFSENDKTDKK